MTTGGIRLLREYQEFNAKRLGLDERDWTDLEAFARKNQQDKAGNYRPVLAFGSRKHTLKATNFVGVLSTRRGRLIEILPKIDLAPSGEAMGASDATGTPGSAGSAAPSSPSSRPRTSVGRTGSRLTRSDDYERTREVFLQMLRTWRGLRHTELPPSAIRSLRRFPMLEVFAHLFLQNLAHLARHGLARRYVRVEDNLPYLRGRLLFQQHVRENLTDRTRFYVAHDEFNPNRPANRLIRSSLDRLKRIARNEENRRLLGELTDAFADVPPTRDPEGDWRRHSVDRTMQHYRPVMAWVRLFLFGQGLATFHGKHENQSLLFPMEKIYEDFVTHCFRRHQDEYEVRAQGPRKKLTRRPPAFTMKPDMTLQKSGTAAFILDTKWKRLRSRAADPTERGVSQADMYQLYAYGKRHGCRTVALVYPRTDDFGEPLRFVFHDDLTLLCLPFDVSMPQDSVKRCLNWLSRSTMDLEPEARAEPA
ncbi:MAG: McrC family protein [Acidobacteria bacterium]|nr:McrC family protein [Acidobacteriota bacterium]